MNTNERNEALSALAGAFLMLALIGGAVAYMYYPL